MNYWIVSPNVMAGKDEEQWKKSIENFGRVFIGWQEDKQLGNTFANSMQINDLVLIAQGANRQKRVFLCGLVASDAETIHLEGTPDEAQNRKLKYIIPKKRLEKLPLNFEGCAYGDADRIPAIYALKPYNNPNDKKVVDILLNEIKEIKKEQKMENYKNIVEEYKQVIFQGAPGTGKTRLAKELAYYIINKSALSESESDRKQQLIELSKKEQFEFIQFHPSYSYEDFIRGIVVEPIGNQVKYEITNKILLKFAEKAIKDTNNPYVLIIDEINRANLPSVLGELIYALEYRDEPVNSVYLKDKDEKIILPSNLYIIGTMNTADRSVGQIDYAIRRRFVFITIDTNKNVIKSEVGKKLFEQITQIFNKYTSPDFNKNDIKIGHSYFIGDDKKVEMNYKFQVLPILKEYLNDGVLLDDAKETIANEFQKWLEKAL
jgi:hypothetical protein